MQKGYNTVIINREKGNRILFHVDQISPQSKFEKPNVEDISTIPSVNDLLEQPLQNEMSKDEIMHDQVGKSEFENSDEDQIMQENDLDYSSVRDRSRSPRERNTEKYKESKTIPKMKQSLAERQVLQGALDPQVLGRCNDNGKLVCLIFMSVSESRYKSLTENNLKA